MDIVPWRRTRGSHAGDLQQEVNRLFDSLVSWPQGWFGSERFAGREFSPAVDVRETDKDVIVDVEVPGVDPEKVDVTIEGGVLRLKGERTHDSEETTRGVHRVERYHGAFERHVALPDYVDQDDVDATCKNGVLTIRIGKREEVKPRAITVKVSS